MITSHEDGTFEEPLKPRIISLEEMAAASRFKENVPVFRADEKTVVKKGDCVRLAEAAAMEFVSKHTSIPVPKVYNSYVDQCSGHTFIVMEFVEGECLEDVWDDMDEQEKEVVIGQLKDIITQLRSIKGTFIGSVDHTACEDQLFCDDLGSYGPYEDEAAFNNGIVRALKQSQNNTWVDVVADMVLKTFKGHETVLTHGDFSPRNILVEGTKVTAILDWEMTGLFPEYWEYVKALYRPDWEAGWFKDRAIDKVLQPFLSELAVVTLCREIVW